jgi:hypothetical protein
VTERERQAFQKDVAAYLNQRPQAQLRNPWFEGSRNEPKPSPEHARALLYRKRLQSLSRPGADRERTTDYLDILDAEPERIAEARKATLPPEPEPEPKKAEPRKQKKPVTPARYRRAWELLKDRKAEWE